MTGRGAPAPAGHLAAVVAALRAAGCVFAEDEAQLLASSAGTPAELPAMVARRVGGEPLEHILGWARFCGQRVVVVPGVFVPRARTELLVRLAVAQVGRSAARPPAEVVAVDLCCGSGAVGAALVAATPPGRVRLYAADIDPVAVACARRNLAPWGAQVFEGDLFAALPEQLRGRVEVLVANVPYVPSEAVSLLPREARLHEPRRALDGGGDGLDVLRRVAAGAAGRAGAAGFAGAGGRAGVPGAAGAAEAAGAAGRAGLGWLAPGGRLLVETSDRQAPAAVEILRRAGLAARVVADPARAATAVVAGAAADQLEPPISDPGQ